ncbi:MAG: Sir2 family NAD-dependent protein deacetylase [Deltaproteobacteria bacterium]|nr:Sir2 family NAD-dependent protein deacetylase [Deltaproteobacteria bacterium]
MNYSDEEKMELVAQWIRDKRRIVVFTGAGVSTESGIPDFRSPGGIWERFDPNEFLFDNFLASEKIRVKYWKFHTEIYYTIIKAEPNPAHEACVKLDRMGKLDCVITQNIDNLHQKAGLSKEKVIELHGNALRVTCLSCGKEYDRAAIQARVESGDEAPVCDDCQGLLKPATIAFGQQMPFRETREAEKRSENAEVFLTVGSSLLVYPAASMPVFAKQGGARLAIVNLTATPYDHEADICIREKAGSVMNKIVSLLSDQKG